MSSVKKVDSYRFLETLSKKLVQNWIEMEERVHEIPWTPLRKPLAQCTVALASSAGLALKADRPFDQEGERQNPWWGDPSFRVIPRSVRTGDVKAYHLHINPQIAEEDLNCLLPAERLLELEAAGEIGRAADHHYSFMGYALQPQALLEESLPAMIRQMQADGVDVLILVPV